MACLTDVCASAGIMGGDPTGTLTIDSHALSTYAWRTTDLTPLYLPATQRGDDQIVPGVNGVRPYRRRITVTTRSLEMVLIGALDQNGTPWTDPWAGLAANIADLNATIVTPPGVGDGTRAAVLTLPDGGTMTADIHVLGLTLGDHDGLARYLATLDISIPAGEFTYVGASV